MAEWHVSDELDARLRERLGGHDVAEYVEQVIAGQLDFEDDPATQARVAEQIRDSEGDIETGRVTDAREAMRQIAAEKGIKLDR
jgi:hypothetical protein